MAIKGTDVANLEPLGELEEYSYTEDLENDSESSISIGSPEPLYVKRIAIIIPAYNEELTIGSVVLDARKYSNKVIVINDGSKDRTAEVARMAGAQVIDMERNSGKAAAIMRGFKAVKNKGFSAVVMMDGDGQHLASDITKLLPPILLGEADLVIGSRFLYKKNQIPKYRQIGQKILNRMTNAGTSSKVSDTQSGFRALSNRAISSMDFQTSGYAVEQDMIVHFAEKGLRMVEVPISVRYDVPNGHKQGSISMGFGLLSNIISTIGYKRPLLLFGLPGLLFCSAGLVVGLLTVFDMVFFGTWVMQGLVSGFLLILGSTLAVSALTLNSLSHLLRMNGHKN